MWARVLPFILLTVLGGCRQLAEDGDAGLHARDAGPRDGGAAVPDARPAADAGPDGLPTRLTCTGAFGSALTAQFGRLDGYLVSIVPLLGPRACRGDDNHLHLQIQMNGAIYDVAANMDGQLAERDMPLPGGAWSEGWHTSETLDYPTLGVHSTDFSYLGTAAQAQRVQDELAQANHISVYMTAFDPTGGHLVHREGSAHDGAIVIRPVNAGTPHILFFDFANQSF